MSKRSTPSNHPRPVGHFTRNPVLPTDPNGHTTSADKGARLALSSVSALAIGSVAAAVTMAVDTGSQPTNQAVMVLRIAVVLLGTWLILSIVLALVAVSSANRRAENRVVQPGLIERVAHRVAPNWVQRLSARALGAVMAMTLVSSSFAAIPARAATNTSTTQTTVQQREALSQQHQSRTQTQAVQLDASSGQQWPIVDRQAKSATAGSPRPPVPPVSPGPSTSSTVAYTSTTNVSAPTTNGGTPRTTARATTTNPASTKMPAPAPTTIFTVTAPAPTTIFTTSATAPRTTTPVATTPVATTPVTSAGHSLPTLTTEPAHHRSAGPQVPHATSKQTTHVVAPGESFWSIAESHVLSTNPSANDAAISHYWNRMIEANDEAIVASGNPDLLFPGTTLRLP